MTFVAAAVVMIIPNGAPHLAKCHVRATRELVASTLTTKLPADSIVLFITVMKTDTALDDRQ